jgi:cysteine-rich repeat protein
MGAALAATEGGFFIGAPHDGTQAADTGAVYEVSVEAASFGHLRRTLFRPGTPSAGTGFGAALASVGGGVLVGAPGDDSAGTDAGAAYLFATGDTGVTLLPTPPVAGGAFGTALATLGSQVAVGAPGAGVVQVFATSGASVLTIPAPAGTRFGAALAPAGANLLVGAPGGTGTAGHAFLFDGGSGDLLLTLDNPTPQAGDGFGASVAAVGSSLVVGAPGIARVFVFDGTTGALVRTLSAPLDRVDERFGETLAVGDAGLLVGSPSDAADMGSAYLFDVPTGTRLHTFENPEAKPGDGFAMTVALGGTHVLVGAPLDDTGLVDGGAAYLFAGPTLEAVFRKRLSVAAFGAAVGSTGSELLVGAPRGGTGSGAVSRIDAGSGATTAVVESPMSGDPRFGFALAPNGDVIAIGAPFEGGAPGSEVGAAYVFAGGALGALANPKPTAGDQFGFALATSGTDVVVGVPMAGERDTGVAYVIDRASGARRVTLQKATPVTGDFFGAALAAADDLVLVGAPFDGSAAPNAGAAYLFRRDTAALERTFTSPAASEGDLFGAALAIAATRVAIGAPLADAEAVDAGAVYVFERSTGALALTLVDPTPGRDAQFGRAVAFVGQNVLVGAPLDDDLAPDTGTAHLFDGQTGALLQEIPNPSQGAFDNFGAAVSAAADGLLVGAPGPSRAYFFAPALPPASVVTSAFRTRATAGGGRCGDGIVQAGEACDDGNSTDLDDCRNNCTPAVCCTLDPLAAERCNDFNPCTDDTLDPRVGCVHTPNDQCCVDDGDCASGKCRQCVGCFLYPWDCCEQGSQCLALAGQCADTQCLGTAFCLCEGALECSGEVVPAMAASLFTAACDQLRLEESIAPVGTPGRAELDATKSRVRDVRRMIRKAAKATRKTVKRGMVSSGCGRDLLQRLREIKQAIPRGKRLRRCVLTG